MILEAPQEGGDPVVASLPMMSRTYFVVGTPSPVLYATLNVVRALVQITQGAHEAICVNTLSALNDALSDESRAGKTVVVFSDFPRQDLVFYLRDKGAPLAICVDDFTTIAHFAITSRNFDALAAARFATVSLTNLNSILDSDPRNVQFLRNPPITLLKAIHSLAKAFQIRSSSKEYSDILAYLDVASLDTKFMEYVRRVNSDPELAREFLNGRNQLERELIPALARHYDTVAEQRSIELVEWPPSALTRPGSPNELSNEPIDLTGPARHIFHGPYFGLPNGDWVAEVVLDVANCFSDNHIELDIFTGEVISAVQAKLPESGVHSCELRFQITDSTHPVEVRLRLLTGAIEGQLLVRRISFRREHPLSKLQARNQ